MVNDLSLNQKHNKETNNPQHFRLSSPLIFMLQLFNFLLFPHFSNIFKCIHERRLPLSMLLHFTNSSLQKLE